MGKKINKKTKIHKKTKSNKETKNLKKKSRKRTKSMVQKDKSKKTVPKRRVEIHALKYPGLNGQVKIDGSK